uniref:Uncharacterized protein n=1 Tax=Rangifer tarandus platyrhynchus TaxID=3082113 RepID=A0ACB0FL00_RANTA|nr:unnamed protein product [Rangifer tarandus platyrhynchus]
MEISASPFIQWCFCMCQEGLKSSLEPCQDMGHRAGLRVLTLVGGGGFQQHQTSPPPLRLHPPPPARCCCLSTFSWSKEGLRVLKVEAQPSVGLEEAHLLSACCAHLGGHGQGTAETGLCTAGLTQALPVARVGALEQVFREQLDEVVTGPQGDLARGMEGWAGGSRGVSKEKAGPPGSPRECVMLARLTDSGVRSGLGRAGPGGGRKAGSATWRPRAGSALATSQPRGGGTSLTGASLRVCSSSD